LLENKFAMHSNRWEPFFAFVYVVEISLRLSPKCYPLKFIL
jgi:hypothetical protein